MGMPTANAAGPLMQPAIPPPPPPPPPLVPLSSQQAKGESRPRQLIRNRLDAKCLMGRVHRQLLESFKCARSSGTIASNLLREKRLSTAAACQTSPGRLTDEMKDALLLGTAPEGHIGTHVSEVLQSPDLLSIILREVECKKHYIGPERPNLWVLGLRYGVTAKAIREVNDLHDRSLAFESDRKYLYIPPAVDASSRDAANRKIPYRITRAELRAKICERAPLSHGRPHDF